MGAGVSTKSGDQVGLLGKGQEEGRELALHLSGEMHTGTENRQCKGPGGVEQIWCNLRSGAQHLKPFS